GDSFARHSSEKWFDREGIPKPMRVPALHFCQRKEILKPPLPLADRAVELRFSRPEEIPIARFRCCFEFAHDERGEDTVNRHTGLLRVQEQSVPIDAFHATRNRVADSHSA